MSEPKRLYRDVAGGKIGGVAAGFAEYLNVDVTLLRVILVILLIPSFGVTLLAYFIAWLIVPPKPTTTAVMDAAPPVDAR